MTTATAAADLRTEYPFVLPRGYVDERGELHRGGAMRLATAKDELGAQLQPKVRQNAAYLSVYLLASTVTSLGSVSPVDPFVIEHLFASDMAFLQDLYRRINQAGNTEADVTCPSCAHEFVVDVAGVDAPGES
ncbi:phage tail assembly protein [Amycolatopsis sp. cg5]|uniref:phage tail assembly protein n=1 Tax=Amycolatopsis sp. cg5 TaxID=3238802 RepID=UPI003525ACE3